MENETKKYELVINTASKIITSFSIVAILITFMIVLFNLKIELPNVWNLCFLTSIYAIYFASFVEQCICIWNVGRYNDSNLKKKINGKSGLLFASVITYFTFIFSFVMYIVMSIILF